MTVYGVTVCSFSRHKGNQRPKCLKTRLKCTCHEVALSVTDKPALGTARALGADASSLLAWGPCAGGGAIADG